MGSTKSLNKLNRSIEESSPLFNYWQSNQTEVDEQKRISKATSEGIHCEGIELFINEPYKWEVLYQSILREIIETDSINNSQWHQSNSAQRDISLKNLKKLLAMLSKEEQAITINSYYEKKLLKEELLIDLVSTKINKNISHQNIKSQSFINFLRFTKILIAIFTNPYKINIKYSRGSLYEYTAIASNQLRKVKKYNLSI